MLVITYVLFIAGLFTLRILSTERLINPFNVIEQI